MALTNPAFEALLADQTKTIAGDIEWTEDEDHSHCRIFSAEILSASGYALSAKGTYNPIVGALSFVLIYAGQGRIYALDLGKDHRNPGGERVGEKHKHKWTEQYRDKHAYNPADITASPKEVVLAWTQFCAEANIRHDGQMSPPKAAQDTLFL
ncbi:MAG TPA: hypothetical protein VHJ20_24725 [Polyangia bacterium]|nr:hypothetical protein [Polyangia bacterium]